jgi:hypothetical protein
LIELNCEMIFFVGTFLSRSGSLFWEQGNLVDFLICKQISFTKILFNLMYLYKFTTILIGIALLFGLVESLTEIQQYDPLCTNPVPCWIAGKYSNDSKSAPERQCVPIRLIIGAAKSGTDLLWNLLKQHPQLALSEKRSGKELNFLNYHSIGLWADNAKEWAKQTPPLNRTQRGSMDFSTRYLTSADAARALSHAEIRSAQSSRLCALRRRAARADRSALLGLSLLCLQAASRDARLRARV